MRDSKRQIIRLQLSYKYDIILLRVDNVKCLGWKELMQKKLFCNIDLLIKGFEGYDNMQIVKFRDTVLDMLNKLALLNNRVIFLSRNPEKVNKAKKFCEKRGYDKFDFISREVARDFINDHSKDSNAFVMIGTKDVDFQLAVNNKILLIAPVWLPIEAKVGKYGVQVGNPKQLLQLLSIVVKNENWYAEINVDSISKCIALYDARTMVGGVNENERQMLCNFQNLLKQGASRNYYQILLYYFLANMTRDKTFDNITIFGVVPSSSGRINPELYGFVEQIRFIKKVMLPTGLKDFSMKEQNLLVRHRSKPQQHGGSQRGRSTIGGTHEFETLCLNGAYKSKIEKLRAEGKLNICIFDDYMNYGNGFNAIRCLLEYIGANKIIFVSMGLFRQSFYKKDYIITGNVFAPGYGYELVNQEILNNYQICFAAKQEIDYLYEVYNPRS
ncbi:hypothetical protein [Butyrivibrio sp. VCD2006]|uniref:hypothetical protein n=1 Tax=Butyrivibrio sp. VCD2006 TaxID=1280664 RepID=UPI0003F70C5E|nr:hypothetical protein [Butyrivibrio sp. VCD2006]